MAIFFLVIGIGLRSFSGVAALYIGTAVIGLAICVPNVLLPSLIKRDFPQQIGLMTGVYTISMNLLGAAASGISVPLAVGFGFGWQGALGIWSILSFAAIFAWLPQVKGYSRKKDAIVQREDDNRSLWTSMLAWQITLFMGLQSTVFFVSITWLPEILKYQGMSLEQSGWLLSAMQLALLPCTFVVPIIAGRMKSQRSLIVIMASLLLTAVLGLLYGNSGLAVLWMIALGSGIGFAFSLAMVFFGLRTRNSRQAAELSGMAQSVGYLIAAIAPTLFGYIHDVSKSWEIPLLILVAVVVLLFAFGLGASRNKYVDSRTTLENA